MAFYVGQKVVCVDASCRRGFRWGDTETPVEGAVYTIASIVVDIDGDLVFQLDELTRDDESFRRFGPNAGYYHRRFRPVQERKTDISWAHELVEPKELARSRDLLGVS